MADTGLGYLQLGQVSPTLTAVAEKVLVAVLAEKKNGVRKTRDRGKVRYETPRLGKSSS